jgi:hypothetical protein
MGKSSQPAPISTMLVDESFASQSEQFVEQVRMANAPRYLGGLADRWKRDPRPWAREQIFVYLALPLDRPGHQPLVKRLFKQAEANRDDELMGAFLLAFDRLVRRQRRKAYRWDSQARQSYQIEELYPPRDNISNDGGQAARNPHTGATVYVEGNKHVWVPPNGKLFSYTTRGYLRRRACRYFRRMGFQRPADYPKAVAAALERFTDDDLAKGENILDSWSLMNLAFRASPVLKFGRSKVELADGRSLAELSAAPRFEPLWKKPESAAILFDLLMQANSRVVRMWATQLLKRDHAQALQEITADRLLGMLDHADEDVQQFGAALLESLTTIDSWPISTWLRMLETRSLTALGTICTAMGQRVKPDRLDLAQCVSLACARATPVARLGLAWLKERTIANDSDRAAISRLAEARCDAVATEAAEFALSKLGVKEVYRTEQVLPFFDSLNAEVRHGAWNWLTPDSAGFGDASLWARLLETPYDDVRIRLVQQLSQRTQAKAGPPALRRQDLSLIWSSVLLGIHRGGRAKLAALRQISQALANHPEQADQLLPVVAVAIRSVRLPEARTGLSAILSAVAIRPELESMLARAIPELRLLPTGVAT